MEEKDTIELIDLLRVVRKYRYLIVIGVVFCLAVAAAWSFSLPKLYRVTTILEVNPKAVVDLPSIIGHLFLAESQKGQLYLKPWIDSPSIIAASVNAGMFNSQIREKMAETLKSLSISRFSFKASNPKDTNMIRISYETADIKMGETILEYLNRLIIEWYQKELNRVRDGILPLEQKIEKNCKARINAISNQIELIDNSIAERGKDKKEVRIEDLSGLILLRGSLRDSLLKEENMLLETEKRLAKLRLSYEEGGPVRIIQKPISSSRPVRPKIKLNILLACLVGLFLSVFLVFFIEYIRKVPKATRKED